MAVLVVAFALFGVYYATSEDSSDVAALRVWREAADEVATLAGRVEHAEGLVKDKFGSVELTEGLRKVIAMHGQVVLPGRKAGVVVGTFRAGCRLAAILSQVSVEFAGGTVGDAMVTAARTALSAVEKEVEDMSETRGAADRELSWRARRAVAAGHRVLDAMQRLTEAWSNETGLEAELEQAWSARDVVLAVGVAGRLWWEQPRDRAVQELVGEVEVCVGTRRDLHEAGESEVWGRTSQVQTVVLDSGGGIDLGEELAGGVNRVKAEGARVARTAKKEVERVSNKVKKAADGIFKRK